MNFLALHCFRDISVPRERRPHRRGACAQHPGCPQGARRGGRRSPGAGAEGPSQRPPSALVGGGSRRAARGQPRRGSGGKARIPLAPGGPEQASCRRVRWLRSPAGRGALGPPRPHDPRRRLGPPEPPACPPQTKLTTWLPPPGKLLASCGAAGSLNFKFPSHGRPPAARGPPRARPGRETLTSAAATDSRAPLTFRQVLDALKGDLELERVVERRRVIQHHYIVHLNLCHILKKTQTMGPGLAAPQSPARGRSEERRPPPRRGPTSCNGDLRNFSPPFYLHGSTPQCFAAFRVHSTTAHSALITSSVARDWLPPSSDPPPPARAVAASKMGSRSRNGRETFTAAPPAGVDQDKGAEQSEWNRGWEARAEAAAGGGRGGAGPAPARRARASRRAWPWWDGGGGAGEGAGPAAVAGGRELAPPHVRSLGFLGSRASPPLPSFNVRPSVLRLCRLC